jgi:hypothetical protein
MWTIKNIEIALRARLKTRASLLAIVPAANIRPEGTGEEVFPAINYLIEGMSDGDAGRHDVTIHLYVDCQDGDGVSGQNQARDIEAQLIAELWRKPQDPDPVPWLNLAPYGYRITEQRWTYSSGPIMTGGTPATFRINLRFNLKVVDQS